MSSSLFRSFSGCIVAALLVAGCGGGGADSVPVSLPDDPVGSVPPVSKSVRGPITGFGSVIVAGVHFETAATEITVDGESSSENMLEAGQIVTVVGSVNSDGVSGSADRIEFDAELRGPIERIDPDNSLVYAVGQVVLITDTTAFGDSIDPASIDGLMVGDNIEVSGFVDANGNIVALFVERKSNIDRFKVKGEVSNLDSAAMRFQIEALVVSYASAALEGFVDGMIRDGDFVKVKCTGTSATCFDADGVLLADKIKHADGTFGDDGDEIEIESIITRFESAEDFDVAGQAVTTNAQTRFDGGSAEDLALNVRVKVEGQFDTDGVLVASKIKIKRNERIRITATADSTDPDANTLTVLGVTFLINEDTRFRDRSDMRLRRFALADIMAGDPLEVRGYQNPPGSGQIVATRVERQRTDPGVNVELQGYVDEFDADAGTLVVQGIAIASDADTKFSDEFFARVIVGALVRVRGDKTGDLAVLADKVTLKDDDTEYDDELKIEGFVTRFESAMDFDVAGHPVTTTDTTEYRNGTVDDLSLGARVEIKGMRDADGVIVAKRVKFKNDDDNDDGDAEFEGYISNFVSPEQFDVAGHAVTTTANTVYEDGTVDDLADGIKVEAEGVIDDAGVLVASEIEFKSVNNIRIVGAIQLIDADLGAFTVLGINILYGDATSLHGDSELVVGDVVSVRAGQRTSDGSSVVASSVHRQQAGDAGQVELRANVELVSAQESALVMLGVTVVATADTVFAGGHEMPLSADEFFAAVKNGALVSVRGVADDSNVVTASRMSLNAM